jgi:hypothetical protein
MRDRYLIQNIIIKYYYMKINNTEEQLKTTITHEHIDSNHIYYSITNKAKEMFSLFGNDRLLIFNYTKGMLYYNNEFASTPFIKAIPPPKNEIFADMNVSMIIENSK